MSRVTPAKASEPIAEVIERLVAIKKQEGSLTVEQAIGHLGSRSIALSILLFALPNSLPVPGIPLLSTLTGVPIVILALQLMAGSETVWLPRKIREHELSERVLAMLGKAGKRLHRVERVLKPRWPRWTQPPLRNIAGAVIAVIAVFLAMPIPFANFPCGFAIAVLAIGLGLKDGMVVVGGLLLSLFAGGVFFLAIDSVSGF